ncbi:50S ribosomal protein L5 [Candidatus Curtissbacteria bacterium RBG_13_40_7]|uniref:Large ribosomal subunit protein uL5 n=1 Tax=Candidatus Curtissbacteria bacterium RBG_13_40_7 TaxID=1797706 RepID=A0A1F5FX69_9BACT|nr:MAG: 50S ribosomal protein L5 [Candidatus Curtissbacteria bacterium RBG_13_40_7]
MNDLFSKYQKEVVAKLKEEFNLKNDLAVPTIDKIAINCGIAEAITNKEVIDQVKSQLASISGQQPHITKAKKAISSFKLKKGDVIGVAVTLRGKRAWHFLEKLISIVMPKMRDFRGLPKSKFDKMGNYSFGFSEQIVFPEIEYSKIDKIRGLSVSIVLKNSSIEKSQRFFELLGIPFKK